MAELGAGAPEGVWNRGRPDPPSARMSRHGLLSGGHGAAAEWFRCADGAERSGSELSSLSVNHVFRRSIHLKGCDSERVFMY